MKKTNSLFCLLLVIVFVFTSIGDVSADEAPPPLDGQTLPAPTLNYPNDGLNFLYNYGINFNWTSVPGADKYLLELQREDPVKDDYFNAIPPMTITSKTSPVPPTVASVAVKKPLPKGVGSEYPHYRWRVTAINTDVGADPIGTGQPSDWRFFSITSRMYSILDMFPGSYSGVIDYKKGDGTNSNTPTLNWVVDNGGSEIGRIYNSLSIKFKITISDGKNKYTKLVPAHGNCNDAYFSNGENEDALCSTAFSGFDPDLAGLTLKTSYTWEVIGVDQPDATLFPTPVQIMPAMKDTLQYNADINYPVLLNAVVTDTKETNKPTFRWNQPAGGLPDNGAYQFVLEGYDSTKTTVTWKSFSTPLIIQGVTKLPGTNTIACPKTGETCHWFFKTPFNPYYIYRWNVRILAAGKYYGPWANPGTSANPDDMVGMENGLDFSNDLVYENKNGLFNVFSVPTKPVRLRYTWPLDKSIDSDTTPDLRWRYSATNHPFYLSPTSVTIYTIDLIRTSPAPLTKTIRATKSYFAGELELSGGEFKIDSAAILPAEYGASGLPRGVYKITITPKAGPITGQAYVVSPPLITASSIFTIAPAAPTISGATYNPATKKLSVTFNKDTSTPAANVKYRMLVKMQYGDDWRWIKIGTYAGSLCPEADTSCTITFFAYKPGTKNALESGEYRVNIQEAKKEEGASKKWGPFGALSAGDGFSVTPW